MLWIDPLNGEKANEEEGKEERGCMKSAFSVLAIGVMLFRIGKVLQQFYRTDQSFFTRKMAT